MKQGDGNVPTDSVLRIYNLSKNYYSRGKVNKAVDEQYLSIENGELFGLLGANGAGKTTILNIVSGLLKPSNGRVWVGGYDVEEDMDKVHAVMGVCPQFDILFDEMTVREHLMFYAGLKGNYIILLCFVINY
jgi:ABC-type multidrug transport system ATPase subunit